MSTVTVQHAHSRIMPYALDRAGAVVPPPLPVPPPSPRDLLPPRFFSPSTDPLSLLDSFHSRFLLK